MLLAVAVAFFFTAVVEAFRVTFATALLAAGADFFAAAACRLVVVVPQDTESHPLVTQRQIVLRYGYSINSASAFSDSISPPVCWACPPTLWMVVLVAPLVSASAVQNKMQACWID